MLDTSNMFAWAWDARPYPNFPGLTSVWHDTPNYELGHWLTGRLEEVPLQWIIAELCAAVGVTQYDCSALQSASTLVLGYATSVLSSPRDILAGLMDAFQFDACESNGTIKFFAKGNVRVTAIDADGFVIDGATDPGYALTRSSDTDLPGALRISFADPFRSYGSAAVEARKAIGNSQNVATVSTAATLDGTYASDIARSLLQQVWAGRETGRIKLPPSLLRLDAGDALTLAIDGLQLPFRVRSIETSTYRTMDLVGFDPSLLKVSSSPEAQPTTPRPRTLGPPVIEFLDLPLVTGAEAQPWAPRVVAYASPWAGIDLYRGNGGGGFDFVTTLDSPSVIGELTSPLYAGPVGRWDHGNTVSLRFYGAANLLSLTEAQVLGGAGALAVKNAALGQWEVLQFQSAALTGVGSYNLTKLLRGQLGTEGAMANPVPAGARVVFLDASALVPLDMTLNQRGLVQSLRYGPSPYPVADARYTAISLAFMGVGLRPYSVSRIAGIRARPAADVALSWARRTRFAGDAWDPDVVPLNEDFEVYDLEVLDGTGHVVRTVAGLSSPGWFYAAADQAADFGTPQLSYRLNLYQISALYGRGQVSTETVYL